VPKRFSFDAEERKRQNIGGRPKAGHFASGWKRPAATEANKSLRISSAQSGPELIESSEANLKTPTAARVGMQDNDV